MVELRLTLETIIVNATVSSESSHSFPLVTMLLVAYNQASFIEQAMASALAQDYPNLEIIISDDRSSDATFDIIQRVVSEYQGPHRLIARQTSENIGTLKHLYQAVRGSTGKLIVVAAGDDISVSTRVSTLVKHWQSVGALALSSAWFVVDDRGNVIGPGKHSAANDSAYPFWFSDTQYTHISGATAAYDRRVFEAIMLPDFEVLAEDYFFSLMLGIRSQKVVIVSDALVYYRTHAGSVINRTSTGDLLSEERRLERYRSLSERLLCYVAEMARTGDGVDPNFGNPAGISWLLLAAHIKFTAMQANWIDASLSQRFAALARSPHTKAKFRWLLPRLGGIRTLRVQQRLSAAYRRIR